MEAPAHITCPDCRGYCQLNGFALMGFAYYSAPAPSPSGLFASDQEEQAPPFPLS